MNDSVKDIKDFLSQFPDNFRVDIDWNRDECGDVVERSIVVYDENFNEVDHFITYME